MSGVESRRGFTLLETLVAMGLGFLILTVFAQILIPMSRGSVRGSQQVELQQAGQMALDKLARDLAAAPPEGITLAPAAGSAPDTLSVQPVVGVNAAGNQVWETGLDLYWLEAASGQLRRKAWRNPDPPNLGRVPDGFGPFLPSAAEVRQIQALPASWVLARNVKVFQVDLSTTPLTIRLSLEAPAPDGRPPERFDLSRSVYQRLNNSY